MRLTRAEPGPGPVARAGEWGRVRRISAKGALDIELAGYSRPRGVALSMVNDIPQTNVIPCDQRGVALELPHESRWRQSEASGFRSGKDRR